MQILVRGADGAARAVDAAADLLVGAVVTAALRARCADSDAELDALVSGASRARASAHLPPPCPPLTPPPQRLLHAGRDLDPRATLAAAGLADGTLLELVPRLRGGGGDGGSTGAESRTAYLEMHLLGRKKDKVDPAEERLALWTTCHLSGAPLAPPCAVDELGFVYNKDAVVAALVAKAIPKGLAHIAALRHVADLKLERAPGDGKGAGAGAGSAFVCPVTGLAMNGRARFVAVRAAGGAAPAVAVAERALREAPAAVEELAGGRWEADGGATPLNPAGEELEAAAARLALRRDAERAAKRAKKATKAPADGAEKRAAVAAEGAAKPAAKRPRAPAADAVDALAPAGADKAIWNSLFRKADAPGAAATANDFMTRGGHRLA
jgi:hypothetical protein